MYLHDTAGDLAHIHQCLKERARERERQVDECMIGIIHFHRQTFIYSVILYVSLTHAVLHHHKATLVAIEALTLKATWCVHTRTLTT